MAKNVTSLTVQVNVVFPKIKLWEAIKLRIAGPEVGKLIETMRAALLTEQFISKGVPDERQEG